MRKKLKNNKNEKNEANFYLKEDYSYEDDVFIIENRKFLLDNAKKVK